MFISKLFSHSRPTILNLLVGQTEAARFKSEASGSHEYFYVGLPPKMPISPEGSMLAILKLDFLSKNSNSFAFGSVGDSGGVSSGYIPQIPRLFADEMKLDFEKFHKIVSVGDKLRLEEKAKLSSHEPVRKYIRSIEGLVPRFVCDAMRNSNRQDLWTLEFALQKNFSVEVSDVSNVLIPNTYLLSPKLMGALTPISEKLIHYNPKHPVTRYAYSKEHLHNWLL
ncbi:hypothetical protein AAFO92_01945 [Roseovarius sp. CAU 1744]|uniref:hypothetical protein n=1 Tax=Roseovarius sp. CAU 1744 TaxID=3140368 RepID=UPI00325BE84A